jgi:uncharacterized membrane protein YkvA (DUF1232 family)
MDATHVCCMRLMKIAAYLMAITFSAVYILNPGAGIFELLPDNLPIVGNLDEAAMVAMLLYSLRSLRGLRRVPELTAPA